MSFGRNTKVSQRYIGRGFTLIELMVTITVMAVLLTIAVPSFNDVTLGSKLSSYANNLVASAHLARGEAIKRNAAVTLCASSNGTSCTGAWENGWIVLFGTTVIQRQQALSTGITATDSGSVTSINFQPAGVGATCAVLTFTKTGSSQARVVVITTTGRASASKTTTFACS